MTYRNLWQSLQEIYTSSEAQAVVRLLLKEEFGLSLADVLSGATDHLGEEEKVRLSTMIARLRQGEPVQYILGYEQFCGHRFRVSPDVLIPRPETEELCRQVISVLTRNASHTGQFAAESQPAILDIGTGSGCIAITLATAIPSAHIEAWDISEKALAIARENAESYNAHVSFHLQDALNPPADTEKWDVIVSNPPYICERERRTMPPNVLNHEPAQALFVPDADPLCFYQAIACYAVRALKPDGQLFFEINPLYADELSEMLKKLHFIEIFSTNDQFGKQRFIRAKKNQTT